jgi:hypothetical protein
MKGRRRRRRRQENTNQEKKTKKVIIISSCPRSISLLIGLQPWGLWNLSLCQIEGYREWVA